MEESVSTRYEAMLGQYLTPDSTSNSWAIALDGATGRVIWEYHYRLPADIKMAPYGSQNRGANTQARD